MSPEELLSFQIIGNHMQNFFAFSKREGSVEVPMFITDELNRLSEIEFKKVHPKGTFEDTKKARQLLMQKLNKLKNQNLLVKDFLVFFVIDPCSNSISDKRV